MNCIALFPNYKLSLHQLCLLSNLYGLFALFSTNLFSVDLNPNLNTIVYSNGMIKHCLLTA